MYQASFRRNCRGVNHHGRSSTRGITGPPDENLTITLNVTGYVLASGKAVAPSLDAGVLIRRYIQRMVEEPVIRDCAPQLLEQMITEQGTKGSRSEEQLVAATKLRRAEVRAVLNGFG